MVPFFLLLFFYIIANLQKASASSCSAFAVPNTINNTCDCIAGLYQTPSGSPYCSDCDLSCKTCIGPLATNCTSCFDNDTMINGACVPLPNQLSYPLEFLSNNSQMSKDLFVSGNWTAKNSPLVLEYFRNCENHYIVGGYNAFGNGAFMQKTFVNLIPHYSINLKFNFYQVDDWSGEFIQIFVDNVKVFNRSYGGRLTDLCGIAYYDMMEVFYITLPHQRNILEFMINSTLKLGPLWESWGLNNFGFSLFLCDSTCLNCTDAGKNFCTKCYGNATLNMQHQCICFDGFFLNISNILCTSFPCSGCQKCLPTCQTCQNADTCSTCISGYHTYIANSSTCQSPPCQLCTQCSNGCISCSNATTCDQCQDPYLLNFTSKTCVLSCNPNTIMFNRTCYRECPDDLYWNGTTCITTCPIYMQPDIKKCVSSCPSTYFLVSNICYLSCPGTQVLLNNLCVNSCPINFNVGNRVCKCPSTEFYLQSDTQCSPCIPNCQTCIDGTSCIQCKVNFFYYQQIDSGINSCQSSCPFNMIAYNSSCFLSCPQDLFWDGINCVNQCPNMVFYDNKTCITNCPSPFFLSTSQICYSVCPQNLIKFNRFCLSQCPENYQLVNNSCVCNSNLYFFPPNSCLSECPTNYFQKTELNGSHSCGVCSQKCLNCSGGGDDQCTSCPNEKYFISEFSSCYETCPDYYFPNNQSFTCNHCGSNCEKCQSLQSCQVCKENYRSTSIGCVALKNLNAIILSSDNLFSFKIKFSPNWNNFYQDFIKYIAVENMNSNDYKISTSPNTTDKSIDVFVKYYKSFNQNEKNLTIWLNGEDLTSNSVIFLIDQNLTVSLNALKIICSNESYYSQNQSKCLSKDKITFSLSYTSDPLIYELQFSKNFSINIQNISLLSISSLAHLEYNFTISQGSSALDFKIQIFTDKAIVNSPSLVYFLNISDNYLENAHIYMPSKKADIKMLEFYPISASDAKTVQSINSQSSTSSSVAQGSGYASTLFSSGSGLFVQGLMLAEMIFLLKFVDLHYPPMVKQMFESKKGSPSIFFNYFFIEDKQDLNMVPPIFQYYQISVYFLNNIGEAICQIAAIIFVASFFLWVTPYEVPKGVKLGIFKRILIFIRNALVWDVALMYILMNLQKIVFFVACSCMFPPHNSLNAIVNLSFASIIGFILVLWLIHLFEKIRLCQSFKTTFDHKIEVIDKTDVKEPESGGNRIFPVSALESPVAATGLVTPASPKDFFQFKVKSPQTYKKGGMHILVDDIQKDEESSRIQNQSLEITADNVKINDQKKEKSSRFKERNEPAAPCNSYGSRFFFMRFLFKPRNPQVFLKRYEMIHLEFKPNNIFHKYYAFFYYIRQCILSILAVFLFNHPIVQIILINLFNLVFVFYTIFSFPFTNIYSFVVCVINELITESAFFGALMIGFYDFLGKGDIQDRISFGWMIIYANLLLLYWVIGTGILRPFVFTIYEWVKKRRELRRVHINDFEK